jgi:hypothetical protein
MIRIRSKLFQIHSDETKCTVAESRKMKRKHIVAESRELQNKVRSAQKIGISLSKK